MDLRTRVKSLGSERKNKKEKMEGQILTHQEEQGFHKNYMKVGQEAVPGGNGTSNNVESTCSGDGS